MAQSIDDNEILFTITKEDVLEESKFYLGRELTEDEYIRAKKLLEFGIGENLRHTYWGVFYEILNP